MAPTLKSVSEFQQFLARSPAAAVYFCGPDCGVCLALEPKLAELFRQRFSRIPLGRVDVSVSRELAAQQGVFTVPTLIVYVEGRESVRRSRAFSLVELERELARPYQLLFGGEAGQ